MSEPNYKKQIEDLQILVAWSNGELSEGQATRALDVGRIEAREMRHDAAQFGYLVARTRRTGQPNEPQG